MEAALLMLDALAVAVLVFSSLRNDRLPPGRPPTGPFRFTVDAAAADDTTPKPRPGRPGARR